MRGVFKSYSTLQNITISCQLVETKNSKKERSSHLHLVGVNLC